MNKKIEVNPNFIPQTPTKVLTATGLGGMTITTKLYGDVSPERLAAENAMLLHRIDQLQPYPKRPERIERIGRNEPLERGEWDDSE